MSLSFVEEQMRLPFVASPQRAKAKNIETVSSFSVRSEDEQSASSFMKEQYSCSKVNVKKCFVVTWAL
jgi:hypothetical protein